MEQIYSLAFQRLTMNYPQTAIQLYHEAGTAAEVYANKGSIRDILPEATDLLCKALDVDWNGHIEWATREVEWCDKNHIKVLYPSHPDYPQRLLNCIDAPIGLFTLGNADLNAPHILSIVGTRQATAYGTDMIHRIVRDMRKKIPDLLVVSGLAYGIDVCAHREALAAGLDTVGVLAHGLDTMYPASHRNVAAEMTRHGGLLTEYPSHTRGDRQNFLRRNRIVAGIADCTIVAESMEHGGSLVTARLASDYGRDVFAIPGRVNDKASEGCNELIRRHKAHMLLSAQDIIDTLGWMSVEKQQEERQHGIQPDLFPNLSPDQRAIIEILKDGDKQLNAIASQSGLHISKASSLLFELEMQGMIKALAGGTYHLLV